MAKQDSLILIKGTIGELSFYKTRDGYFVRKKTVLSGARVKCDPAFKRTRQNADEFGRAARAGKVLRTAFAPLMEYASDSRVTSRLAGALFKVIRADMTHPAGQRTIIPQHATLLKGFNFNRHGSLPKIFLAPYSASIDRTTGSFTVSVPTFNPSVSVRIPHGATHLRFSACGVSVDFESGVYESAIVHSSEIFLEDPTAGPISLCGKLPDVSSRPIFLVLCLEFLQETNGRISNLMDRSYNAMAIVKVDGSVNDSFPDAQAIDQKPRPNPRHTPVRHPSIDRNPVARPLTPLEFP
ncbi:MAG TPA: hypothetical protein VFO86_05605, partial [Terriglobia bacterium]|nr:hypothetical protein [Terriglobia bacterium]